MQNNDFYTEQASEGNGQQEEVDLGTFKSVKTLKEAYDCLRKTFTQNAMELAKYKKEKLNEEEKDNQQKLDNEIKNDEKIEKNAKNDEKSTDLTQNNEIIKKQTEEILTEESDKVDTTPDIDTNLVDKVSAPTLNRFEGEEWQKKVQDFFVENEDARQYASEIGRIIMHNEKIKNSIDPLERAWIEVLKTNSKTSMEDSKIEEYAMKNDSIKQKIIAQYLSELQHKKSAPKVILERGGAQLNATNSPHAISMAEAKELAKKIMIK